MKKKLVVFVLVAASIGLFSFILVKKAGKAGYTGSPGENACNNCHNTYALGSGPGSLVFNSDIPGDLYTPDSIYHITLTVKQAGVGLFGFGMEALKTGNTNAGLFLVTNSTRTQILTAANSRKNMTHKLNGGAFNDSSVFEFNWQAPSTNVGPVTFYFTGVCADASNSNSGDYVYKGSHTVSSISTVGIETSNQTYADLEVHPFPTAQLIEINFLLNEVAEIKFYLAGMDGKVVQSTTYQQQDPGIKSYTMYTTGLNSGVYFLHAEINGVGVTRKFLLMQ
jgi:hypothetical protein